MSEEKKKVKNRKQKSSKLMRWLHTEGRRYCAIALCASLIAGNLANLAVAADDDPDYKFQLDRVALYEALQQAVAEGNTVDSDFGFEGADADTYEISMAADGSLYELTPEIDDNDGKLKLRVFARLDENIELVDDISDEIGAENASYEIDGSEAFYFLLTNSSDTEQTAVIRVGEKETELIYVIPHSAVEMPEPEGKAVSSAQDQVIQAGAEISQEAGPGITDATAEGETADIVTVGGSGSSGGSGGGGGSSGGNASGKNPTESVEIETEAPVDNTEAAIQPETKPDTEAESTETETEAPEIEIPDMEVPEIEVPEANAPEVEAPETDAPEIESAEQETPKADAPETDAANPEPVQPEAPAESEDSTEAEAYVPEINVPDEAPEADVEIQIDNEPEADMDVEESEVSVVDGSKSNDVAAQDTVTDNVDVSDGSADDAVADDTSEEAGDVESADSAAEVTAAITLHETCRVAASKAIQSDATPSDAEKATPSDATPSDEAKDTLDGTVLNAVRLGDDSAVVFVTAADELGLSGFDPEYPDEMYQLDGLFTKECGDVLVDAYVLEGTFDEPVRLSVEELSEGTQEYQAAEAAMTDHIREYDGMLAFDISFWSIDNEELEPNEGYEVQVAMRLNAICLPAEIDPKSLMVHHIAEDESEVIVESVADTANETTGRVQVDESGKEAVVTAEFGVNSFSVFTITFTTGNSTNKLNFTILDTDGVELSLPEGSTLAYTIDGYNVRYSIADIISYCGIHEVEVDGSKYVYQSAYVLIDGTRQFIDEVEYIQTSDWSTSYKIRVYAVSGEENDFYTGPTTVGIVYRRLDDGDNTSVNTDTELQRSKTVTLREDGTYDLELSLSGAVGSINKKVPVDIVFVIDQSGSMETTDMNGRSRAAEVGIRVGDLTKALTSNVNLDTRYSVVRFSSGIVNQNYYKDAYIAQYWTRDDEATTSAATVKDPEGGTNYEAGLRTTRNLLLDARPNAQKYVVFMSDGAPTYHYDSGGSTEGGGNYTTTEDKSDAYEMAKKLTNLNGFYSIRVGSGTDSEIEAANDILSEVCSSAHQGSEGSNETNFKNYSAEDADKLKAAFDAIQESVTQILCENVVITDTLSQYVQPVSGSNPILTVYDEDGKQIPTPDGIIAEVTEGILTVDFPDEYQLEAGYTYVVKLQIEPSEIAYTEYKNQNEYPHTGDDGTGTYAGQEGFYSNDGAKVTYVFNENEQENAYPMPVIQIQQRTVTIKKVVTGPMGDKNKKFTFNYSIDDGAVQSFVLADGESKALSLKRGSKLVVNEVDYKEDGYEVIVSVDSGDENEVTVNSGTYKVTSLSQNTLITFTNNKDGIPDTGILLDSMPYVLILAAVVAGAAFYFIRRKKEDEDDLD